MKAFQAGSAELIYCLGGKVKLHRAAIVAGATLIAAACSGEEPAAAPDTTVAVVETTVAPTTTAAPTPTTVAPTTAPAADDTPESLAFASSRDVGRLFEIDGATQLFDGPGGDVTATLEDGRLVQAGVARTVDGVLLAGIVDPNDPTVPLGWVEADSLRPTNQFVTSTDPSRVNQLGAAVRASGQDSIDVASQPGGTSVVATLEHRESALFTGNSAIAADGQNWLQVASTTTSATIGWIPAGNFVDFRGVSAVDSSFEDTDRRPASGIAYGAALPPVSVATTGCNAVQIELDNPSSTLGMAFVLGNEVPSAVVGASRESWSGSTLFVEPGDSTTITLNNSAAATWYFAALNGDFEAEADRNSRGELQGEPGSRALATNVEQVFVPVGSCAFVPPPPEPDSNIDYDPDAFPDIIEESVDETLEGELGDLEGSDQEGLDGEPIDPALDPATATTTTTTVAPVATIATTAAPTTTTVAPPPPPTTAAVVVEPPADPNQPAQG